MKQSFVLTVSTGISAAGGFVAWSIAAHVATPHAVGIAAGMFSSCALLSYLTNLALPYGLLRYGYSAGAPKILRLALAATVATSILGAVVFALGCRLWAPALASELGSPATVATFVALNAGVAVAGLADAYFVAQRRAGLACGRNTFVAIGKVGALIVLGRSGVPHASSIYLAMLVPVTLSTVCVSVPAARTSRKVVQSEDRHSSAAFMRFSLKNYPGALLDGAPSFLLPVLVFSLVGPTANAYFYIAWSISGVVALIAVAIGQVTLRESATSDSQRTLARRAMTLALVVTGIAVLTLSLAAGLVLHIFGSAYSGKAVLPVRLLLLSAVPGAYLTITTALLRGRKRYGAVNQAGIAYAGLSIGGAVGFGVIAGVNGACLGWLIGVSLAAGAIAVIVARHPSGGHHQIGIKRSRRKKLLDSREAQCRGLDAAPVTHRRHRVPAL